MSEPPPRRAIPDDAAALNALARAAYAVYVPVIGREPQPMATDWQTLFASQEIWIIDGPSGPTASLALEIEPPMSRSGVSTGTNLSDGMKGGFSFRFRG